MNKSSRYGCYHSYAIMIMVETWASHLALVKKIYKFAKVVDLRFFGWHMTTFIDRGCVAQVPYGCSELEWLLNGLTSSGGALYIMFENHVRS
jgi:hypothetical protein